MTAVAVGEQALVETRVEVRVVDSDVHPVPRPGEWIECVPEPYRGEFWKRRTKPHTIEFDPPNYVHAKAQRLDAFPDDGGFPGTDPEFAFRQLILEAGSDIAILQLPLAARDQVLPEHTQAAAVANNHWLARHWLNGQTNRHERWRAAICVAIQAPQEAAREIEHWAGHSHMPAVLIKAEPRPSWGDPRYDPVWEAATRHGLPVMCHLGRGYYEELPMPPAGPPSYWHDFMSTYSLLAANQLMSLVFDGVFERFPSLQIVFSEHGFSWLLPVLWRMDAVYEAQKRNLPLVRRKPSEYVYDHVWLTTQPVDPPENRHEFGRLLEWLEADRLLLFSSDYPHWTFDDPKWVLRQIPRGQRERIMFQNAIDLFGLPATLPALEGQNRVW